MERRENDGVIIGKLGRIEERLDMHMDTTNRILDRHDVAIYGKDGQNGLLTTVSKLKSRVGVIIWASTLLATGIVTAAVRYFA